MDFAVGNGGIPWWLEFLGGSSFWADRVPERAFDSVSSSRSSGQVHKEAWSRRVSSQAAVGPSTSALHLLSAMRNLLLEGRHRLFKTGWLKSMGVLLAT